MSRFAWSEQVSTISSTLRTLEQQVADGERPKCGRERARTALHQSGRNSERPSHSRVDPVIEAARDDSQP